MTALANGTVLPSMATIRPLERDDLNAVAELMQAHLLTRPLPGSDSVAFLAATLLDDPWTDPELPSLVAEDEAGRIVGLIGSQPRPMLLDRRPIRGVCCSHFVVAPDARAQSIGPLLLRKLLGGPQTLTWSDSASDAVVRLWGVFGGHVDHTRACDWMLVLRPARWARAVAGAAVRGRRLHRDLLPVGGFPLHAAGSRLVPRAFPPAMPSITGEPLPTAAAAGHAGAATAGLRLRPDFDQAHLDALFDLIERAGISLVRRMVRRRGEVVGWYVFEPRPGRASRVYQLVARHRESEAVLSALVEDARERGCAVLTGRLEPALEGPLARRLAILGFARRPIIHTPDADVRSALLAGSALISQLDGEWWVT